MFVLLCLLAAVCYGVQATLMVSYYRRMDTLSAVAYRGLSLGISALPFLFLVDGVKLSEICGAIPELLGASLLAVLANWCAAVSFRYLPVGIAGALFISATSIITISIGFVFFGERLSASEVLCVIFLVGAIVILGVSKSSGTTPEEYHPVRGVAFSILNGIFLGGAYVLIGVVARESHPFLAGYSWEFVIGVMGVLLARTRGLVSGKSFQVVPWKDFWMILLYSSPTAIGSAAYAYATTIGPVGLAGALLCASPAAASLAAVPRFGERPSNLQWAMIFGVIAAVIGLEFLR